MKRRKERKSERVNRPQPCDYCDKYPCCCDEETLFERSVEIQKEHGPPPDWIDRE